MLVNIFKDQKAAELEVRPNSIIRPKLLDQFCHMVSDLRDWDCFDNCHISLAHLDLEPRNILINPISDASSPILSAILDWDSAILAPQFMCCKPPFWLWCLFITQTLLSSLLPNKLGLPQSLPFSVLWCWFNLFSSPLTYVPTPLTHSTKTKYPTNWFTQSLQF